MKLGTKATIVGPSGPNVWWKTKPFGEAVDNALKELQTNGPRRIMCDDGIGRSPKEAHSMDVAIYEQAPTILIRDDGWTLGAHQSNLKRAYSIWKETWVAFVVPGKFDDLPLPIGELEVAE